MSLSKRIKGVVPNYRVLINRDDRRAVIAAGGCISHLTAPEVTQVYLEGKLTQLKYILKITDTKALSEFEEIPFNLSIYTRRDGVLVPFEGQ